MMVSIISSTTHHSQHILETILPPQGDNLIRIDLSSHEFVYNWLTSSSDTPQADKIRLFAGLGDVKRFRAPPPPNVNSTEYEKFLIQVKEKGARANSTRTAWETETAYYWRESSPM